MKTVKSSNNKLHEFNKKLYELAVFMLERMFAYYRDHIVAAECRCYSGNLLWTAMKTYWTIQTRGEMSNIHTGSTEIDGILLPETYSN